MPSKPLSPCATPGCPRVATNRGRCAAHSRQHERERGTAAQRGYDARWRRARDEYLREHPWCVDCQAEGQLVPATEVDHVIPLRFGGANEPSNYAARCKRHHSAKTMRQSVGRG